MNQKSKLKHLKNESKVKTEKMSKPWLFCAEMKYTHKAASYENWQIRNPAVLLIGESDVMDILEQKILIDGPELLRK